MLTGCGDKGRPTWGCTANRVPGLWLVVDDDETGVSAECGAVAWARDGTYVDTLSGAGCTMPDSMQNGVMTGVYERSGIHDVFVEKAGYETWQRSGVQIVLEECWCHVCQTRIEARLVRSR
jgi:hypothetical protein